MKTQHELFDEWNRTCEKIKHLNGIIQTDFDSCIRDGYITLDDMSRGVIDLVSDYDSQIKKLNGLRSEMINFIGEKIREHSNQGVMK